MALENPSRGGCRVGIEYAPVQVQIGYAAQVHGRELAMPSTERPLSKRVTIDSEPSPSRPALPAHSEILHDHSGTVDDAAPLHLAVRGGDLNGATALLERGADPNEQDKLGMTPLHWAAIKGHMELARLLLFYEADIHLREHFSGGVTPVGMAQLLGYEEVAHLMEDWPR
jgi:Ankyrin repeats (3 copies)